MTSYVLDANMISLILRRSPSVVEQFNAHLQARSTFIACPFVIYEIERGLLYRDARKQAAAFEGLLITFIWQDYARADWTLAAQLWRDRIRAGRPFKDDHDLMIAAFARNRNAVVVTNNEKDFVLLGTAVENWANLYP